MWKMNIVLGGVSLFVGIVGILGIYIIYRNDILKKKNGKHISGKKINCREIWGKPIRYVVEVEYQLNSSVYLGKIVTADKKIRKYEDNEQIPLLYVDTLDKIFWAEDNSHEKLVCIFLLITFCFFMFLLAGVFFVLT